MSAHIPSRTSMILKGFVSVGAVIIILVVLIVILPKTSISVTPKHVHIDEKMELTAHAEQKDSDADRRIIPSRLIERDVSFTKTFAATGSGDVKAQKAQGTITIYNEYSEKPQPLVATTRFLSESGVLFRLVNAATVPGMKDGEPGQVDALVIADEAGDASNIGPVKFSIPGFDGSPKKSKFYAKNEKAMTGGGSGGEGVVLITQDDIDAAQKDMVNELDTYVQGQIKAMLRPDSEVLLTDAMTSEVTRSEASVSEGTMGEDFMYEIVTHAKVVVFAKEDVRAIMEARVADEMEQYGVDQIDLALSYDEAEVDFEKESLKMKVQGVADITAVVELENFKNDIIGKNHDELLGVIEERYNNTIEKITIESVMPSAPGFIANQISRMGFMTNVFIPEN